MALEQDFEALRCWVELDLGALRHNVAALRSQAPPGALFMAVVKADAYGHGVESVVPALRSRVDWFGVANLTEARTVRALASEPPLMVLGPALPAERAAIVAEGFVPVVSSHEEALGYAAASSGRGVSLHLALDTGMGRVGVWEEEAVFVARQIAEIPGVQISGVASHFPSADEDDQFTAAQSARFNALVRELRELGLVRGPAHIANSAGVIGFADSAAELFRAGLAMYGVSPRPEFQSRLQPVLSWKTRVSLVREVGAGRGVSYGRTYLAPHHMRVATLAVGYADGFQRHLSNRGAHVLIGGRRCALLGRVTMDQIMVDVSRCDAAVPGAEAVLIGRQGAFEVGAVDLAAQAGTIPWEIFTGIGRRVRRLVLQ